MQRESKERSIRDEMRIRGERREEKRREAKRREEKNRRE